MHPERTYPVLSLLLLSVLFVCPAESRKITSDWKLPEIEIDGKGNDWVNISLKNVDRVIVGACNDDRYLYLYFATKDRQTKMQLLGGLGQNFTVWLDAQDAKKRRFGIRFSYIRHDPDEFTTSMTDRRGKDDSIQMKEILDDSMVIEIVKPEESGSPVKLDPERHDIQARVGIVRERLIYELKIPLKYLGDKMGNAMSIGFETSEFDEQRLTRMREKMQERMKERIEKGIGREMDGFGRHGAGGFGDRMGGDGMMGPGGMGRGQGGPEPGEPERFEFWTKLKLAKKRNN